MGTTADKLTYLNDTKTAIKNAIIAKGGTVESTDTFRSYADKIAALPTGASESLGITFDTLFPTIVDGVATRDTSKPLNGATLDLSSVVVAEPYSFYYAYFQGYARLGSPTGTLNLSGLRQVSEYAFAYAFYSASFSSITEINMSGLEEIVGDYAFYYAFYDLNQALLLFSYNLQNLKKISGRYACGYFTHYQYAEYFDMPNLEIIDGANACDSMIYYQQWLRGVDIGKLKTVRGNYAMTNFLRYCSKIARNDGTKGIESVDISSLETIEGSYALSSFFNGSYTADSFEELRFQSLKSITGQNVFSKFADTADVKIKRFYFPALTELATDSFVSSSTGKVFNANAEEIHFRADMQSVIEGLVGYANKWGATNAQIVFDL